MMESRVMLRAAASTARRWAHWVHIGVLVGVGLAIDLVVRLSWAEATGRILREELQQYLLTVPGLVYHLLPIAAAISVAMLHRVRAGRVAVLRLAAVVTATMVLLDVSFAPAPVQVGERLVVMSGRTVAQRP